MSDWVGWHGLYDDPTSTQSKRLVVVRQRVGESLDALGPSVRRVLSLCAGDGRDLLPALAARPAFGPEVLLVEFDPTLAARARAEAAALDVDVSVRVADASLRTSFDDVLPVDLLLLCGIFGNVPANDIRRTADATSRMLAPGGFAIWTRGRCEGDDLRPTVRTWFREAGLTEVAYDEEVEGYGVGVARAGHGSSDAGAIPNRLFSFFR